MSAKIPNRSTMVPPMLPYSVFLEYAQEAGLKPTFQLEWKTSTLEGGPVGNLNPTYWSTDVDIFENIASVSFHRIGNGNVDYTIFLEAIAQGAAMAIVQETDAANRMFVTTTGPAVVVGDFFTFPVDVEPGGSIPERNSVCSVLVRNPAAQVTPTALEMYASSALYHRNYVSIVAYGTFASLDIEDNDLNPPTPIPMDDAVGEGLICEDGVVKFDSEVGTLGGTWALQFDKTGGGTASVAVWGQYSDDQGVTWIDVAGTRRQFEVNNTQESSFTFLLGSGVVSQGTWIRPVGRVIVGSGVSLVTIPASVSPSVPSGSALSLSIPRQRIY